MKPSSQNNLLDEVKDFYSQITNGAPQQISDEEFTIALNNAKMRVENQYDMFVLLASLNLLNAAKKQDRFKEQIEYGSIKGHVSRVLTYCINHNSNNMFDALFINQQEHCAYIKCFGILFSFHNIHVTPSLLEFVESEQNKVLEWEGIRLQPIASFVLQKALQLKLQSKFQHP